MLQRLALGIGIFISKTMPPILRVATEVSVEAQLIHKCSNPLPISMKRIFSASPRSSSWNAMVIGLAGVCTLATNRFINRAASF